MVLDGSYQFRPDLQKIGRTTIEFGVPLLFLTATLAVPDIPAFIQSTGIDLRRTTIFRSSTVRANLRYSVTWVDQTDGKVPEAVRQIQVVSTSSSIPRILTYCFSRPRSEAVGKLLRCPVYHARIGTKEEKSAIVRKWVEQGGCIVSTNALGVGLDIADVRYVFHIGIPGCSEILFRRAGEPGATDNEPSPISSGRALVLVRAGLLVLSDARISGITWTVPAVAACVSLTV
ncbi:hypothetical protein PG988_016059 [Apiospora saccharicola]